MTCNTNILCVRLNVSTWDVIEIFLFQKFHNLIFIPFSDPKLFSIPFDTLDT